MTHHIVPAFGESPLSIHYRHHGAHLIVFGNTYPVRDQIKALGGRFNGSEKNWQLPYSEGSLTAVASLCASWGGGALGDVDAPAVSVLAPLALSPPAPFDGASTLDDGMTIRQLMDRANVALTAAFPTAVWVIGEIQNLTNKMSGTFLELAEAREKSHGSNTVTARAVIWSRALAEIKAKRAGLMDVLQDGMMVRCLCQVQLYRDRGQVSLMIEDIDPSYTKGALALAREKLLKELRAKGLDRAQKALQLTPFPFRLGLISAEGSRAKSDFLDQLKELRFPGDVLFVPTAMQGESVPEAVVRALKQLVHAGVDLIVVTRGGGSAADLRWFDAPEIAYAIAACPIPVIAAIGHHEDVAVAEEIAYLRQKTPTAAADFVGAWFQATRERIDERARGLADLLGRRIEEFGLAMATLVERLSAAAERSIAVRGERLSSAESALHRHASERLSLLLAKIMERRATLSLIAERALTAQEMKLATYERLLATRDPKPWLVQGWTQLSGVTGPIRSLAQVKLNDEVVIRLADGRLRVVIKEKLAIPKETRA